MKAKTKFNWLWVALPAMVIIGLLWDQLPAHRSSGRFATLPAHGNGFISKNLPLNESETQVYRDAEVVKRIYRSGDQSFILTAIDSSRNRHAVHDPAYCFTGAGWHILREQALAVPGGAAKMLSLSRSGRQVEIVYWFTNVSEKHTSASHAWWSGMVNRLSFGQCGSSTVLVVLQPKEGDALRWQELLARSPFLFQI